MPQHVNTMTVIPAQAGIHALPSCGCPKVMDPGMRRDDGSGEA